MDSILEEASVFLSSVGLEVYPFKIGWYNDQVSEPFRLDYPYDTLALCIISSPGMFEKGFKPFLRSGRCTGSRDPLDQFLGNCFNKFSKNFPANDMEIIFDYELLPSRRPRILVQTAGHVSGAAFYYRRENVKNDPWQEDAKIHGVSIHEKYAGWFGFRGVVVYKNVCVPRLEHRPPPDVVQGDEKVIELLEKFNYNWKDWSYRDIIPAVLKYSDEQILYFNTLPADRHELIKNIISTQTA